MHPASRLLSDNVRLLKQKASKHAVIGVLIASVGVVIGTLLSAYIADGGKLTLNGVIEAQKTNPILWLLNFMPFVFGFWGQYSSSMMAYEAGAMVMDQTDELRTQTATLEKQIAHQATHDPLTELPNRILFTDLLVQTLHMFQKHKERIAVIILDLDGFKEINDTIGHHNGDRVLKGVATRLRNAIDEAATLARLGGDEFGLITTSVADDRDVDTIVQSIKKALDEPYLLEGITINVAASIGVALSPDHGKDADTLMQRADVAMYVAKDERSGKHIIYSDKLDSHSPKRLTLIGELKQAIQSDDLELYYQPRVSGQDGTVLGMEGLIRWNHPRYELLQPGDFIPMAERTGIIRDLSVWVTRRALADLRSWQARKLDIGISINLTAHSLLDPEFPNIVIGLLATHDLPKDRFCIEMTESVLMTDQDRALEALDRLLGLGMRFAIDDFGTGYSSMAYLKKLPADEIKIDRTFVSGMATEKSDAIIVNAIVQLAHNLGFSVTAEGIENSDVLGRLQSLECDALQGNLISPPMPVSEVIPWVEQWRLKGASELMQMRLRASPMWDD